MPRQFPTGRDPNPGSIDPDYARHRSFDRRDFAPAPEGRMPAEGEELLLWMKDNERAWRT